MSDIKEPMNDAFNRLQDLLLTMRAGDHLDLRDATRLTGLAEPTLRIVLERLTKAGMMSSDGSDRFVRVTIT